MAIAIVPGRRRLRRCCSGSSSPATPARAARARTAADHRRPRPGPARSSPAASASATCSPLTIGVMTDRLGVPPQDDHRRRSSPTPKRVRVMGAKVVALLGHRRDLRGAVPGRVGRARRGSCSPRKGHDAVRRPGHLAHSRAGAARARPVGAHRSRGRHPHPQPGRGAAHRDRRRLDRRADPRRRSSASPSWGSDITPYLPSQATSAMLSTSTGAVQRGDGADPQLVGRRPRPGRLRRGAWPASASWLHGAPRHQLTVHPPDRTQMSAGFRARALETG